LGIISDLPAGKQVDYRLHLIQKTHERWKDDAVEFDEIRKSIKTRDIKPYNET
jgi:hypothetical protein